MGRAAGQPRARCLARNGEFSVTAGKADVEITFPDGTKSGLEITAPSKRLGSTIPWAKLTEDIVRECRTRYAAGETQAALAAEFHVSDQALSKAVRGLTWQHVETAGLDRLASPVQAHRGHRAGMPHPVRRRGTRKRWPLNSA